MFQIEYINDHFRLPIEYIEDKYDLDLTLVEDLELHRSREDLCVYDYVFKPNNSFGKQLISSWCKYYTDNRTFLTETNTLLQNLKDTKESNIDLQNVYDRWYEIKNNQGFKEKYQYIDWKYLEKLNNSSFFLQIMSICNIISPLISLIVPILMLLVPFFLLKLQKVEIDFQKYVEVIKRLFKNHAIGKIFMDFNQVDWEKRIYILVSLVFYFVQMYQNILVCIRFYCNYIEIHKYLYLFRDYFQYTMDKMDNFLSFSKNFSTYQKFNIEINNHKYIIKNLHGKLAEVSPQKISIKKFMELGNILKYFYQMYDDKVVEKTMMFCFGFHGYIDNIRGIQENIQNHRINPCKFYRKKATRIEKGFYPPLMDKQPVKNTVNLNNNFLITGPNASGKTTLIKSIIINIILSQQLGCGFYENAKIKPFRYLHCYLNIPDTSGRDSLFQAEARRCKEILDKIISSKSTESHFCIFDELYSGTNPYEAIGSAYSYLQYLTKRKNVNYMLTTHFIKLCNKLDKRKKIQNFNMQTKIDNNTLEHTYLLKKGISNIKGGINVLQDLEYPEDIINDTRETIQTLE